MRNINHSSGSQKPDALSVDTEKLFVPKLYFLDVVPRDLIDKVDTGQCIVMMLHMKRALSNLTVLGFVSTCRSVMLMKWKKFLIPKFGHTGSEAAGGR
jgi:hypothetical protein